VAQAVGAVPPEADSASDLLRIQAERLGGMPFVRCGGDWMSYAELDDRTTRLARGLVDLGVKPGDRVALVSANSVDMVEAIFACSRAGAVQVPINVYLRGAFLRHQLEDPAPSLVLTDVMGVQAVEGVVEAERVVLMSDGAASDPVASTTAELRASGSTARLPTPGPQDLGAIMYTSGTTGVSKGCMIPNGMFTTLHGVYEQNNYILPGDRMLTPSPLFHMGCQSAMLMGCLGNGASVSFVERFSASGFMAEAREINATVFYGVGAAAMAILAQPPHPLDAVNDLRAAVWVPMPPGKADEFEHRFGVPTSGEAYGQTEFMTIAFAPLGGGLPRGCAGLPTDVAEVAILDERDRRLPPGELGEIGARPRIPDAMYMGYWNRPADSVARRSNLWHHTGDVGRLDEQGILWITDRKSDVIRRRGENVSATEVETAIQRHAAVEEAAVHGVPSEMSEQDIKACVRLVAGAELEPDEFFVFLRDAVPYFAVPRYVQIVDDFPRNAVGRIRKDVLRERGVTSDTWDLVVLGLTIDRDARR
jgi:crotonobetaine/carnitine-CoA ligase